MHPELRESNTKDASYQFRRVIVEESSRFELEVCSNVFSERARLFCSTTMTRMLRELRADGFDVERVRVVFLLCEKFIGCYKKGLTAITPTTTFSNDNIKADMIQFMSVVLFTDLYWLSLEKAIDVLKKFDRVVPFAQCIIFISSNILAFPATDGGHMGTDVWSSQRNQTERLVIFERIAPSMTGSIFLSI